jgi:hypothetical protein
MKILFSCEDFSEKSFASLINRAPSSCSGSYQALPSQSLDGGHNREKDSNSQNEEMSRGRSSRWASVQRLETWLAGRGDVARSASPQDRRPTKQAERGGHTNPVQLMPPRFEHEDDLVAAPLLCASVVNPSGFGVRSSGFGTTGKEVLRQDCRVRHEER